MSSFGIEWDTNVLVYMPGNKLPEGIVQKTPVIFGKNWTITLEGWHPEGQSAQDCLYSLELQLGVFKSKTVDTFNIEEFRQACADFTKYWNNIIDKKSVTIGKNAYHLVILSKECPRGQVCYSDCARTVPAVSRRPSYTEVLAGEVFGIPQITCGIQLEKTVDLFHYFYEKELNSRMPFSILLMTIKATYDVVGRQILEMQDQHGLEIDNPKTVALLLWSYYYLLVMEGIPARQGGYIKSFFALKLRTNLLVIYDYLDKVEQEKYRKWLGLMDNPGNPGFSRLSKPEKIRAFVNSMTGVSVPGYKITNLRGKKSNVPSLGIFTVPPYMSGQISYEKIGVFTPEYNRRPPPLLKYSDGIVQYHSGVASFDYGEWVMDGNMIFVEIRIPTAFYVLEKVGKDGENQQIKSAQLCEYMNGIIQILNGKVLNSFENMDKN
jgi:hypothetical protein